VRSPGGKSSNELAEDRTNLALGRTLMAADRSLMAWVRTALSLISFGFTLYKVLQGFQDSGQLKKEHSARTIGLFLTAMGTFAIVAGTIDYWRTFKELRRFHEIRIWRPSFLFAIVMSALGLVLFFEIIAEAL
jgi:putative membrane protein